MRDNIINNDIVIAFVYDELDINNARKRRLRYLRHVINLAAKAFLYTGDDAIEGSFNFKVNYSYNLKMKPKIRQAL